MIQQGKITKATHLGKWEEAEMLIFVRIPESSFDLERKIQEQVVIHVNRWRDPQREVLEKSSRSFVFLQQYGFN